MAPGLIPGLNELARRALAAGTDVHAINRDAESAGSVFSVDRSTNREINQAGPHLLQGGKMGVRFGVCATAKPRKSLMHSQLEVVAGGGIEPPTQGFSVLCSTD